MPPKRKLDAISVNTTIVTDTIQTKALKLANDSDNSIYVDTTTLTTITSTSASNTSTPIKSDSRSPVSSPLSNNLNTVATKPPIISFPFDSDGINMIKWAWKENDFEDRVFNIDVQQIIEDLYIKDNKCSNDHKIQDTYYRFSDMTHYVGNGNSNNRKPIQRIKSVAIWAWEKSRGIFDAFSPDQIKTIETHYLKGQVNYAIDTERYINFSTLEQIRLDDSTKKRRLSRTFIETNLDIDNPTWYFLTYDPNFDPVKWEIYPDTIDIERSFQSFLKNGKAMVYKSSNNDLVSFAPIQCTNSTKFNSAILKVKRSSGSPDIVPLVKRSYSQLSEEEKKEIIIKTLNGTLNTPPPPTPTPTTTTTTSDSSQLYLPGEEAIINGNGTPMKYILRPCRQFSNSGADFHFRTAESQFYRLLNNNTSKFKVTKVEYVVNPKLIKSFNQKKAEFEKLKYPDCQPVFGFHGTSGKNIIPICTNNFSLKKAGSATDTGYYGLGLYFSEYPEYSIEYISDCSKILLCKVLLGKSYKCNGLILGQPCQSGYTSHLSPDEMELVIFNPDQVLPLYIVHYQNETDDTNYYSSYQSANAMKSSKIFSGTKIHISGGFSVSHALLQKMIKDHGGDVVTKSHTFTHYVCSKSDANKNKSQYIGDNGNIPLVTEDWVYQSIISSHIKNPSDFGHTFKQEKKTNDIKPLPLDHVEDDDVNDSSDDSSDDEPKQKPLCKYGAKCYRKNAKHFQDFSHEHLAD